ncbi:MAG: hypothetical protein ACHQUC_07555 [Chlamydiales bacterium]
MILPLLFMMLGAGSLGAAEEDKSSLIFHKLTEQTVYYYTGTALESASLLARFVWGLSYLSPQTAMIGKECLFLSQLCDSAAKHLFAQMSRGSSSFGKVPFSQISWHLNKMMLSQVPASTQEDEQLLHFLEKRWLAKATGFFSLMVDWVCPCFGISVQVHPETTGCCYARSPWIKLSQTYINRVEDWKQSLPHPQEFPLILTRPFDIQGYLPSCIRVAQDETIPLVIEKIAACNSSTIVDFTHVLCDENREKWLSSWNDYREQFSKACKNRGLNLSDILCIQQHRQASIGGIRLLPLSTEAVDRQHQFLLDWVSNFGLSANFIELDRWSAPPQNLAKNFDRHTLIPSKEEFISFIRSFKWTSDHPQKNLMMQGTLLVLKGLFDKLSEEKWNEILRSPTRSSVVQLSFSRIQEQLRLLSKEEMSFFDMAGHLEEIHANLSSLLEICVPFKSADFSSIYRDVLTSIPPGLKSLTSYGIHSSGMTSITGIFKAVQTLIGKTPHVLYGENTYYECIKAAHLISKASSIEKASEEDWKEVDLILAQFNPVLKGVENPITEYKTERIADVLQKAITEREGKPLTLALDCTLDFIDSPKVARLLTQFQEEIRNGSLNVVCFRSGLKFDLFGMDNYCGAPFYMIHAQTPAWAAFDALLTDPVLQTDRLSLNWFCLAYQSATCQLELYCKQIFDNTKNLLSKIPPRLLNPNSPYRIVPVEEGADPAFIDIKVSGPLHQMRGSMLIGGCLSIKCMEGGQPIFYRPSLGLYHPNLTMIFSEERTTIRLTLGLDPAQIELLVDCFKMVDRLNDSLYLASIKK